MVSQADSYRERSDFGFRMTSSAEVKMSPLPGLPRSGGPIAVLSFDQYPRKTIVEVSIADLEDMQRLIENTLRLYRQS